MAEKTDDIDPLLDTGEAARRAYAELQVLTSLTAEQIRRMEAWSKKYDADHAADVRRREGLVSVLGKIWAWFKGWLAHGAETASKIRIE